MKNKLFLLIIVLFYSCVVYGRMLIMKPASSLSPIVNIVCTDSLLNINGLHFKESYRIELSDSALTITGIKNGQSIRLGEVYIIEIDEGTVFRKGGNSEFPEFLIETYFDENKCILIPWVVNGEPSKTTSESIDGKRINTEFSFYKHGIVLKKTNAFLIELLYDHGALLETNIVKVKGKRLYRKRHKH
jgi:hypothetical protein